MIIHDNCIEQDYQNFPLSIVMRPRGHFELFQTYKYLVYIIILARFTHRNNK